MVGDGVVEVEAELRAVSSRSCAAENMQTTPVLLRRIDKEMKTLRLEKCNVLRECLSS